MGALEQAADPDARRYEINREQARHFAEVKARVLVRYGLMPREADICRLTAIDDAAIAAAAKWPATRLPNSIDRASKLNRESVEVVIRACVRSRRRDRGPSV